MMRLVIVLLLLGANGALWAWQQGLLGDAAPDQQYREPERVSRQVNPGAMALLSPKAAATAVAAAEKARAQTAEVAESAASAPADGASAAATSAAPAAASALPIDMVPVTTPAAAAATAPTPAPAASVSKVAANGLNGVKATVATVGTECLQMGPLQASELKAAEAVLRGASLPAGSWSTQAAAPRDSYAIYMGPYPDNETLEKKKAQLRYRKVDFKPMAGRPDLEPGLVLGQFDSKARADAAMAQLHERGVVTSRLINLGPVRGLSWLRLPDADAALRERIAAIKWPAGRSHFTPCPAEPHKA